jgi:hypothetical protein
MMMLVEAVLPDPVSPLKGKEAKAFLERVAEPATERQVEITEAAVKRFPPK